MEVYELAIKLSMQDGVSKIIGVLSKEVPILGKHFDKLKEGVNKTSVAIAGLSSAMAGIALFKGLEKLEKQGEHLVHAKTLLEAALPIQDRLTGSAQAYAAAWKEAGANLRTNVTENVEAIHDLYNVTQSVDHATKLLPAFNVLKNSFDSVKDQASLHGGNNTRDIASAVRGFELTGRNDEESVKRIAGIFTQTNIALRGRVSGGAYLTQMSNAGDSRYGFDDDFAGRTMPIMMATGLGNRTGQAMNAFSNNLYGGVSSSQFQGVFQEKWGLHKKEDELRDEKGKFRGFKVGSMWESDVARRNPLTWANDFRKMLHDERGVDVNNTKQMQDIIGEIARGNKSLKAGLDDLLLPMTNAQLNKEDRNARNVGSDAMEKIDENDPRSVRQALHQQWENAMQGLGEQLVKPLLDNVIKPLTLVLRDVSQFAAAHPDQMAAIGKGLLVLSAALTGLGVALVGGAILAAIGAGGWMVVGFTALAAAIKLFKPQAFSEIWNGLKMMFDGIIHLDFGKALKGLVTVWNGELMALPSQLEAPIRSAIAGIVGIFTGALDSLKSLGSGITSAGGQGRGHAPAEVESHARGKSSMASPIASRNKVAAITINHTSVLDGRKVATSTSKHMAEMATHPNAIGAMDSYGSHAGPGTDLPSWG